MLVDAYFISSPTGEWYALINHIKQLALLTPVQLLINNNLSVPFDEQIDNLEIIKCKDFRNYLRLLAKSRSMNVFCINFWNVLIQKILLHFKPHKVIYWVQGVSPEESYMRHKSYFRFFLLSLLEFVALKLADVHIFVSEYMKLYFENKYRMHFICFQVIPCSSGFRYRQIEKRENLFVYVGGMSVWQRVDLALEFFQNYLKLANNAFLKIVTPDFERAQKLLEKYPSVRESVEILSGLSRQEIEDIMNISQFGFLIRDDNPVNNVSSPVKLAEYLSCDINVLTNDCIRSYSNLIENYQAGYILDSFNRISRLLVYFPQNSLKLYNDIFSNEVLFVKYRNLLKDCEDIGS